MYAIDMLAVCVSVCVSRISFNADWYVQLNLQGLFSYSLATLLSVGLSDSVCVIGCVPNASVGPYDYVYMNVGPTPYLLNDRFLPNRLFVRMYTLLFSFRWWLLERDRETDRHIDREREREGEKEGEERKRVGRERGLLCTIQYSPLHLLLQLNWLLLSWSCTFMHKIFQHLIERICKSGRRFIFP